MFTLKTSVTFYNAVIVDAKEGWRIKEFRGGNLVITFVWNINEPFIRKSFNKNFLGKAYKGKSHKL